MTHEGKKYYQPQGHPSSWIPPQFETVNLLLSCYVNTFIQLAG